MANYSPVALFVYERLEHTIRTVEALAQNIGAKETELFIFSDGPKGKDNAEKVMKVRDYIRAIPELGYFKNVVIKESDVNRGLQESIISNVTDVINKYGRIIVVEDDIITSQDFLKFLNGALDYYENDSRVWSVAGYVPDNKRISSCREDVMWQYRACCWGWASWKDRWEKVDWDVSTYNSFMKDKKSQRKFNRGGRDMTYMLTQQRKGIISSWAVRWSYQQFRESMIGIAPKNTKVQNIGFDGSGTNCSGKSAEITNKEFIVEDSWNYEYNMRQNALNSVIQRTQFISYYRQVLGAIYYKILGMMKQAVGK